MPRRNRPSKPAVIFDFDGTLADSLLVSLQLIYQLVHNKPLPHEDMSRLRGMTYVKLFRQLSVPVWRLLFLRGRLYKAMAARTSDIVLVPGVDELLRRLAATHLVFIVSSNDAQNVRAVMRRFDLEKYLTAVSGGANPFSKRRALRLLARHYRLTPRTTWYVGDQIRDVQAAKRAGMRAAAVSWGFSNLHLLELAHPDILAFTPEELLDRLTAHD